MSVQALAAGDDEKISPGSLDRAHRYKLFTGTVIPRPIALVTTLGEFGQVNAAPFSQFVIVAVDPGMLGFSIGPSPRGDKDTLVNVRREREFVINTVASPLAQIVQHCGEDMPPDVSEVEITGLGLLPSVHVRAPRIAQSRVQFECRLERIVEAGSAPNHFVIGEVLLVHIEKGLHEDCRVDTRRYDPIGRLGGRNYSRIGDINHKTMPTNISSTCHTNEAGLSVRRLRGAGRSSAIHLIFSPQSIDLELGIAREI